MRITWDPQDGRESSQGVSCGVLYPENSPGVAWNGLISVTESGDNGGEEFYLDGQKYHGRNSPAVFAGTISAYTYPDEFEPCIGIDSVFTGQSRRSFGFSYRDNNEIHIVYNAVALPSKVQNSTISERPDPVDFTWDFTTFPVEILDGKPSSHLIVRTGESPPSAITSLEAVIYGDSENDPSLPTPAEITEIFESSAVLRVTNNGDGTFTVTGPDTAITMIDADTFQINWPSVVLIGSDTYKVSSSL